MKTRILTATALLAALTAVCSQIAVPLPGLVPLNLATLAVFLSGALLGAKWGAVSQLVYLCIGLVGMPVFSSFRAGPGVLAGPTGGYLIGYVLAAFAIGLLLRAKPTRWMLPASMAVGLALCYTFGTAWYIASTHTPFGAALASCVLPFLVGDAAKILVATIVASRIGILRLAHAETQAA